MQDLTEQPFACCHLYCQSNKMGWCTTDEHCPKDQYPDDTTEYSDYLSTVRKEIVQDIMEKLCHD